MRFESLLEYRACSLFAARSDVAEIHEQNPQIQYSLDGVTSHTHTFDLLVVFKNGTKLAVEVKPNTKSIDRHRRFVATIAQQIDPSVADYVAVVTNEFATPHRARAAERLLRARKCTTAAADDAVMTSVIQGLAGPVTAMQLRELSGLGQKTFAAVERAVADGRLIHRPGLHLGTFVRANVEHGGDE